MAEVLKHGFLGLQSAAREADTNREIVSHLMPELRRWVDLYDVDPATWPEDEAPLLSVAHIALNLYESIR